MVLAPGVPGLERCFNRPALRVQVHDGAGLSGRVHAQGGGQADEQVFAPHPTVAQDDHRLLHRVLATGLRVPAGDELAGQGVERTLYTWSCKPSRAAHRPGSPR